MKTKPLSIACGTFLAALGTLLFISATPSRAAIAPPSGASGEPKTGRFVYIVGEVAIPQRYVYTNGMTLGAAIKMAKGVTAFASEKITLTQSGKEPVTLNLKTIEQGKAKDINLQPGDKVFVPRK